MLKNYYKVLGVPDFASYDEIRTAYRKLAKELHPDKNFGDRYYEERFKEISEAYNTLSDEDKRRRYDLKLKYGTYTFPREKPFTRYRTQARTSSRSPKKKKFWDFERHQIAISGIVAIALIWAVVHFSEREKFPARPDQKGPVSHINAQSDSIEEIIARRKIRTSDSPYDDFFGEGLYETYSKNSLVVNNSDQADVLVLLVNNDTHETIRNEFVSSGNLYRMNNLPDGRFFLRLYFGRNWNPGKAFEEAGVKGRFDNEIAFLEKYRGKDLLVMRSNASANKFSYSTYEIKLFPDDTATGRRITPAEFFSKK